jgi:rRNA maturation endonuclease Nob1
MDIAEMLKKQREAITEPSNNCVEGKEHEFKLTCHADGREFYINYFTCENCGEMIKKKHQRDEDDLMRWC